MAIRVLLIDEDLTRCDELSELLERSGCEVVHRITISADLESAVRHCKPDLVILETTSPSRDVLEGMAHLTERNPHPIAMFVDDEEEESIRRAVRAGVAAYIVRGLDPARVRPALRLAMARFEEHQRMRHALRVAEQNLDDRKHIERAKEMIAERYEVSQARAFEMLRSMAMDESLTLREIADLVLESASP